ncbi:MAG: ATP-binding protein [Lachnospiraceae bacterium]|nr:ATP-binding protein [Lachnospiraceae bacterium]
MGLNPAQYDALMREYDKTRLAHKRDLDERTTEIYNRIPRIKEINDSISSVSVAGAKRMLLERVGNTDDIKKQIEALSAEKASILRSNGYPEDYLSMRYTCKTCKDTGYDGQKKCHCLSNTIIDILYQQSGIKDVLKRENFDTFSFSHYDNTIKDPITGLTALENMHEIVKTCREYIDSFHNEYKNLYLYGATGVGKTFLTNCIAKELIDGSNSVIYVSAIRLFEILASNTFKKGSDADTSDLASNLLDCDLLIIDDLGTELVNSFTASALFNCINERHIRQKSVIISTNLSLAELRANYSERVFSRITSNYTLLKVYGDDLRMKLR